MNLVSLNIMNISVLQYNRNSEIVVSSGVSQRAIMKTFQGSSLNRGETVV